MASLKRFLQLSKKERWLFSWMKNWMPQLRKVYGHKQYKRANACVTVWHQQAVQISPLIFSMEKCTRSLVRSRSLDVFHTSPRGKISRNKLRKICTRQSWFDTMKITQETYTSCTTHMPRITESRIMPSTAKILNIPVTHSWKSCMENTGKIGSWSRDPGLVSNDITRIYKRIKRRQIITNVVLPSGWGGFCIMENTQEWFKSYLKERHEIKE